MSIINLERDMMWPSLTSFTPLAASFSASSQACGADAAVGQRVNFGQSAFFSTSGGAQVFCGGSLILPPADGDATPYRVIGSVVSPSTCVMFGYGWYSSSAVGDPVYFRCGHDVDAVVSVAPLDAADPLFGRPLCFFALVNDEASFTANRIAIGVQRLIAKPPQFASAVS